MGLEDREWFQEERDRKAGKASKFYRPPSGRETNWNKPPPVEPTPPPLSEVYDRLRLSRIRGMLARERVISRLDGSVVPPPGRGHFPRLGSGAWVLLAMFVALVALVIASFF